MIPPPPPTHTHSFSFYNLTNVRILVLTLQFRNCCLHSSKERTLPLVHWFLFSHPVLQEETVIQVVQHVVPGEADLKTEEALRVDLSDTGIGHGHIKDEVYA